MRSLRYLVSGRVQGVGYRYYVVRQADALGVAGWVRNLPDGRVEVVATSGEPALAAFEGRLWEGPPASRVNSVETSTWEQVSWSDFRILPTPW